MRKYTPCPVTYLLICGESNGREQCVRTHKLHLGPLSPPPCSTREFGCFLSTPTTRKFSTTTSAIPIARKTSEELLVVVGGGAAGVYGAIRAKTVAPRLNVLVIEKAKPLSKVKISGGGRCNVTNGHCTDNMILAENYPRGHKEFRGPFFDMHGPGDTVSWFTDHGVELKVEEDGRVFPASNNSSSIIDCLMWEAKGRGDSLPFELGSLSFVTQTKKLVKTASANHGKFLLGIEKNAASSGEYVEPDYLLIASGSSSQGYSLVSQLGHSIVDPVPSLFTFKIADSQLAELLGKQKVSNSYPPAFSLVKRFWKYILDRQGLFGGDLWASISNSSLISVASVLKNCDFEVTGKGQFKDEFVKAGGVPLSEISLNTMESKIHPSLFFAGEVLNVDGVTGGFNFQNAWSGGYIAGITIGTRVHNSHLRVLDLG